MNLQAVKGMLAELRRALRTLENDQGPRARRNAHARVAIALRNIRVGVGKGYPPPARKQVTHTRRTPDRIARDLEKAGWEIVHSMEVLSQIAAAGIRIIRMARVWPLCIKGPHDEAARLIGIYAPGWAVTIASQCPNKLKRAKASPKERKAILTELTLENVLRAQDIERKLAECQIRRP